jgi:ABC-type transport system involved in cytochrome bd biosynthesis fused ATPase/permease subunit
MNVEAEGMQTMTSIEIEIVSREHEHQELLCSEIASTKQFVGGMAGIAAFVVLEWLRTKPHVLFAIPAVVALVIAAILFLILCRSQEYSFPSEPEEWLSMRSDYARELTRASQEDISEEYLRDKYYQRLMATTTSNRELTKSKQRIVEWAGTLSTVAILIVIIESIVRFVFTSSP